MARNETIDQFLRAKGIAEKNIVAFRRVVAWQISEAMTARGIGPEELARRVRMHPEMIEPFLASPESAPLLITTLREVKAALGETVMTFWDSRQ